jgi:hypothetical protein
MNLYTRRIGSPEARFWPRCALDMACLHKLPPSAPPERQVGQGRAVADRYRRRDLGARVAPSGSRGDVMRGLRLSGLATLLFLVAGSSGAVLPAQAASAAIVLSIDAGAPGTPVTVSGSGFPPNEVVALYVDSPSVYLEQPGPVADGEGAFQENIKWPGKNYDPSGVIDPSKVGPHNICGDTGYPASTQPIAVKACAQFTAEAAPTTPTPSPQPGPAIPTLPVSVVLLAMGVLLAVAVVTYWFTREST